MTNNIPILINKTSISLILFSAAILLLLLASPLVLSNILLLQPVQAQTTMTFRTPEPAQGELPCCPLMEEATLTFDVQGTASSSDPQSVKITNGTIQYQEPPNRGNISNGRIIEGTFTNDSRHGPFISFDAEFQNWGANIQTWCSTSEFNTISVIYFGVGTSTLNGSVECSSSSSQGGGGNTTSPVTGTTTAQDRDSDGDGIPDSTDRCAHNSDPRCFKEDTTTQQQSSSPSLPGNQTR